MRVWEPDRRYVVLGRSNQAERELYLDNCRRDDVPVARRLGGGGAVLLDKGMLVVSIAEKVSRLRGPLQWFDKFNNIVIRALEMSGVRGLTQKGVSDVCIRDRKILGSCLHLPKGAVFYHASLLVSCDLLSMNEYLRHPSREPDYRKGRPHLKFVTTLWNEGYKLNTSLFQEILSGEFHTNIRAVNQGCPLGCS